MDSTGTRNYVCDGASVASTVLSDGAAVYSDGSERRSGVSSFRHTDALGSTRGITNASQAATDGILLDAFGMTVSRTGSTPTPFGFVGSAQYQTDADSGLMLLGHRYYDPSIGRFITSDPVQDGTNWYAYCGNDPLGGVDPEGLRFTVGGRHYVWHPGDTDTRGDGEHVHRDDGKVYDRDGNELDPKNGYRPKGPKGDNVPRRWRKDFRRKFDDEVKQKMIMMRDNEPEPVPGWWDFVDWGDVAVTVGEGAVAIVITVNPELWPVAPVLAPALAH